MSLYARGFVCLHCVYTYVCMPISLSACQSAWFSIDSMSSRHDHHFHYSVTHAVSACNHYSTPPASSLSLNEPWPYGIFYELRDNLFDRALHTTEQNGHRQICTKLLSEELNRKCWFTPQCPCYCVFNHCITSHDTTHLCNTVFYFLFSKVHSPVILTERTLCCDRITHVLYACTWAQFEGVPEKYHIPMRHQHLSHTSDISDRRTVSIKYHHQSNIYI